jgi:hypothetical protein
MAHHYRFRISGTMRSRFLQHLCKTPYAHCARTADLSRIDWAQFRDAEIIPNAKVAVDVDSNTPEEASAIAKRIGDGLCTEAYQLYAMPTVTDFP